MDIGKESEPVELPIPVHPDDIPAETPAAQPGTAPVPERSPAHSPARHLFPSGHQRDQPGRT